MELLAIAVVVMLVVLFNRVVRRKSTQPKSVAPVRLDPEEKNVITFDDERITVTYGNGETRSVRWADLTMVGIRTTDEGPFLPDVFWGLHAGASEPAVVYAQGATGEREFMSAMQQRLAGFDNEELINAMCCADNDFFVIWCKQPGSTQLLEMSA